MDATSRPPRLILADDNIGNMGGHYYELASLLIEGGQTLGYQCVLATNASFQGDSPDSVDLRRTFHTRRMIHWSLGVDGHSRYQRDLDGTSIGGGRLTNRIVNLVDRLRPKRPPVKMLHRWADDVAALMTQLRPDVSDRLLINTGDDFAMLALASALRRCDLPPFPIDVIFHFALFDGEHADRNPRLQQLGNQVRQAVASLAPHCVRLHATTANLAHQMQQAGLQVSDIPYPTRAPATQSMDDRGQPYRIVLAGLPRKEKGRGAIHDTLALLEPSHLRPGHYRMSMQMPSRRWQRMVPASLRDDFASAVDGSVDGPLEILTNNLTPSDYHAWLDRADIGLFLYDADRYVARCSGVLLEMMVRGVPVIVPDGCWLADQVRHAGGDGSIGYIYKAGDEIASLLSRHLRERPQMMQRSIDYASTIIARHCGKNTLLEIGIPPVDPQHRRVA